jgi:hypothetical protein
VRYRLDAVAKGVVDADNRPMNSRHQTIRNVVAPATLLLTLFVSACGSDDKLSKSDYLTQGNAICQKVFDEIDTASEGFATDRPPTQDEFTKFTSETLIPKIGKMIDDLDKLNPPSELNDGVDKLITSARADYTKMQADIKADWEAFMNSEEDPFANANAQANAIGLTVCGNP